MTLSSLRFMLKSIFLLTVLAMLCQICSGCGLFSSVDDQEGAVTAPAAKGPKIVIECDVDLPLPTQASSAAPGRAINSAAMERQLNAMATASQNLNGVSKSLNETVQRLSKGLTVNPGGSDAAGLTISEKLRAQVGGLNAARRGVGQAIITIQTQNDLPADMREKLLLLTDKSTGTLLGLTNLGQIPTADQLGGGNKESNSGNFGGDSPFSNSGSKSPVLDMELNPEGANMVALQVKQQLGAGPTILGNQSPQVLQSLFRAPAFNPAGPLWSLAAPDAAQNPLLQTA